MVARSSSDASTYSSAETRREEKRREDTKEGRGGGGGRAWSMRVGVIESKRGKNTGKGIGRQSRICCRFFSNSFLRLLVATQHNGNLLIKHF